MPTKVSFTAMEHGTTQDYALVAAHDAKEALELPDRVLGWLRTMEGQSPYQISRLEHCLQSATRAERDNADDETVLAVLLHDIGDVLCPTNHSQVAAALLRPYVSEKNYWIVLHHGLFQGYYYFHHFGKDQNVRDKYANHEHFDACVSFCRDWDQISFDPKYKSNSLEHYEPLIREFLSREPTNFV